MIIKRIVVGELETNCYIIADDECQEGVVIDPGDNGEEILRIIDELEINVKYILNTHGHADHIGANKAIKDRTDGKLLIHEDDLNMLTDNKENLSAFLDPDEPLLSPNADKVLKDGDTFQVKDITFEVIHTPGHTRGGVVFKVGNTFFTGDTLFADSIGRTDFPGGSYNTLIKSIHRLTKLMNYDSTILPGHGPGTNFAKAKENNPYLFGI